jgi:pimeloyl-ACP methyl ester carboxylesterase
VPPLSVADLEVDRVGTGPPVVLVHGSIVDARRTWRHQLDLADEWALCIPNRPGFGASPPLARGDFEAEAPLMAELLGDGAHLVGHSYGAVIALLAAAARPEAVRSLTVSEPGSLRVAAGDPAVDAVIAQGDELYRHRSKLTPREFVLHFRSGLHSAHETPDELPTGWSAAPATPWRSGGRGRRTSRSAHSRRRHSRRSSSPATTRRRSRRCATCSPSALAASAR